MSDQKSPINNNSTEDSTQSWIQLLFGSPLNSILTLVIAFLVYKLVKGRTKRNNSNSNLFISYIFLFQNLFFLIKNLFFLIKKLFF
jgi:hypothetical protein